MLPLRHLVRQQDVFSRNTDHSVSLHPRHGSPAELRCHISAWQKRRQGGYAPNGESSNALGGSAGKQLYPSLMQLVKAPKLKEKDDFEPFAK